MKKIGLIVLTSAFLVNCTTTAQTPSTSPKEGDMAPDFSLVAVSGNQVRLSDFRGKKNVVLVFYFNGL